MSYTEDKYEILFCCSICNEKPAILFIYGKPHCSNCMGLSISSTELDPEVSKMVDKHFWGLV